MPRIIIGVAIYSLTSDEIAYEAMHSDGTRVRVILSESVQPREEHFENDEWVPSEPKQYQPEKLADIAERFARFR